MKLIKRFLNSVRNWLVDNRIAIKVVVTAGAILTPTIGISSVMSFFVKAAVIGTIDGVITHMGICTDAQEFTADILSGIVYITTFTGFALALTVEGSVFWTFALAMFAAYSLCKVTYGVIYFLFDVLKEDEEDEGVLV